MENNKCRNNAKRRRYSFWRTQGQSTHMILKHVKTNYNTINPVTSHLAVIIYELWLYMNVSCNSSVSGNVHFDVLF